MIGNRFLLFFWSIRVQGYAVWTNKCARLLSAPNERYFRDFIGNFMFSYPDGIFIYSDIEAEHIGHAAARAWREPAAIGDHDPEILPKNDLFAKIEKCAFHVAEIDFFGLRHFTKLCQNGPCSCQCCCIMARATICKGSPIVS